MALHKYHVVRTATIEIGGVFEADTLAEAVEQADRELRAQGEISDNNTIQGILVDDEAEAQSSDPEPSPMPRMADEPERDSDEDDDIIVPDFVYDPDDFRDQR